MLRPPFSSEYDPSEESEGSIDPLGLAPVYERLADRLLPGVTVRMGRPRFLTAMVVGARVCEEWGAEDRAKDEVTPAWLVYEWFVIEALHRARDTLRDPKGIPGIQKVERAIRAGRPVTAPAYLKTPTVFGFSGIFRRLARYIGLLTDDGGLDDGGWEVLGAWEKDQSLPGFVDGNTGAGADFRNHLRRVVAQGMASGSTTHQPGDFWNEIAARLDPSRPGKREGKVLLQRICERSGPLEMVSVVTQGLLKAGEPVDADSEPDFLRSIGKSAGPGLRELLTAIDAYEAFGRALTDAFDGLRHLSTRAKGAMIDIDEIARARSTSASLKVLHPAIRRVRNHEQLLLWEKGLESALAYFDEAADAKRFVQALLEYHHHVQQEKPPEGKRDWLDRDAQDRILVRPGFMLKEGPALDGGYVHEYRIPTYSRFLGDLGAYA